MRGGELRIENGDVINTARINPAASLVLGGGTLRINGDQTLPGAASTTVPAGNTVLVFNPQSETVASSISLGSVANPMVRTLGATLQVQVAENGGAAVGSATIGNLRVSPRILIPGLANSAANTVVPGIFGNNGLDFVTYDGTTTDSGQPLGIRELRNPGSVNSPFYANDPAETGWNDTVISRTVTARTLTANRALEALKVEAAVAIALTTFNLRIETGGIIAGSATSITSTAATGFLTAGPATPGANPVELFLGGNNTLTITAPIANNGSQAVALVKTGSNTLLLDTTANTYTGGTFLNSGTITAQNIASLGAAANTLNLNGGTLTLNVSSTSATAALGGFGQNVVVNSNNSVIVLDNGTAAGALTDYDYALGSLSINGPYTLGIRGFDSEDLAFTSASFTGTPTIDLPQAGGGSNPNTAAAATVITLGGAITGSGFYVSSSGNTDNTSPTLQIGAADAVANTYSGKLITLPGSNNDDLIIQLNKVAGTTAVTGDIEMDGGVVRLLAANQIADTSNLVLNNGLMDFNGQTETIASVTMNGGRFSTGAGAVTITGDANINGVSSFVGTEGFNVSPLGGVLSVQGTTRLGPFSKTTVGADNATLSLNALELTGATITQINAGGSDITRLSGDVTTFANAVPSNIGNSTDSDTFTELNGTRTFTVADGGAGLDLVISSVLRNSTAPVAVGGLVKAGPGTMQLQGGGTANSFTGPVTINEGSLVLFKTAGVNALNTGAVTVGDGVGGAKADKLVLRSSNQIADAAAVTVSASGVLDLQSFNTSEQIASLAGAGAVDVGTGGTLTVSGAADASFAGTVQGGGGITKGGASVWTLSGASNYLGATTITGGTLLVNGSIAGSTTTVGSTATLGGSGTVADVTVSSGGNVAPGSNGLGLLGMEDFSLQSGGKLTLEIGGNARGTGYDAVNVTGGVTLAGDLQGSLINAFTPGATDVFFVLVNDGTDAISGTFNGLPQDGTVVFSGQTFTVTYTANFEAPGGPAFSGGNDVALLVPEPTSAASLLTGVMSILGLKRFRRRRR